MFIYYLLLFAFVFKYVFDPKPGRKCQKPHHTLLHTEAQQRSEPSLTQDISSNQVSSN